MSFFHRFHGPDLHNSIFILIISDIIQPTSNQRTHFPVNVHLINHPRRVDRIAEIVRSGLTIHHGQFIRDMI